MDKKPYIISSHERCLAYGIAKEMIYSRKIISGAELLNIVQDNEELIQTAMPFINELYNFVKGSNFFVILTDKDGCILNMVGDEEIVSKAYKFKMLPGAYMDEKNIGANAMGTAIAEGMPVQISGKEHFITAYHRWTCSGAPIKNSDGEIIGSLDLTGYSEEVHSHTLGLVAAAANAIGKTLELNKYNAIIQMDKKNLEIILNSIESGLLTADLDGNILAKNKYILNMFGYTEGEIARLKIFDLFEGWENVKDNLEAGKTFVNEDVFVNARRNKLHFNLSAYPSFDKDKILQEIVCVFKDIKNVRKLAGKIMAGQAIYSFNKIIGNNEKFLKIMSYAKKISDSKSTILILGESGTGKEVFAQAIHNHSSRRDEPFVAVNCGAIPRNLIESELFGYEEGSFTGARKGGYAGKFELADDGTIFLDEIGEMPNDMQVKLLRVIEESVINRIGSSKQVPVNVRIIAATNKDLMLETERGNFRKDLYYRLNVLPLYLPPLRERKDDIPLLIEYFMNMLSKRLNKKKIEIPDEYTNYLINYDWPGNIRELENLVELIINTESLPINIENTRARNNSRVLDESNTVLTLDFVEQQHILKVLKKFNGNITLTAKTIGMGRNTLYRKLSKYGIECSEIEQCANLER